MQVMSIARTIGILLGMRREPSLEGVWERRGDAFAGCRVEVAPAAAGLRGIIVHVPDRMLEFGWLTGDAKWTSILRAGPCLYRLDDLHKVVDRESGKVSAFYRSATLRLADDDLAELRTLDRPDRAQEWRRITA